MLFRISLRTLMLNFCMFSLLFAGSAAAAFRVSEKSPAAKMLNRSIISVGSEVYTLFDVNLLLALWNALSEEPVLLTTDFSKSLQLANQGNLSGFKLIQSYPADVRRLLFIFFVWDESRRLNLFAPTEKSFADARLALSFSDFSSKLNETLSVFWNDLGEDGQKQFLDIVIRARSFARVRQGLEANQRLTELKWFWHLLPSQ